MGLSLSGGLWLAGGTALGAPAVVDLSSRDPIATDYPVSRLGGVLCDAGGATDGTVLAAAVVTYGRRPGRSAWGHTSLRFLACADGRLRDVEYEYYRMDASIERWFRAHHGSEAWTSDATYLRRQHGALVVVRNDRPVDGGFYAVELRKNREIIEAWMPWPPGLSATILAELDARHDAQLAVLRSRTDLDGYAYEPMGTNCTLHVREALAAAAGRPGTWAGSVFPMTNLTLLEQTDGVRFVVHPSAHVVRRAWTEAGVPETLDTLPRGLWRRGLRRGQRAALAAQQQGSEPVVVRWLLDTAAAER